MKSIIYIETSVISYLTARPSRDVLTAARQTWTRDWWDCARDHWTMAVSELVVEEAARGDPVAAAHRLDALRGLNVLPVNGEARDFARQLIDAGALPPSDLKTPCISRWQRLSALAIWLVGTLRTWWGLMLK